MRTVEVRGVNFKNKGAELMLLSILNHYKGVAEISLPINPSTINGDKRKEYQLFGRISAQPKGIDLDRFVRLLPVLVQKSLRLKTLENTDLILDASGFAYSDQWGADGIKNAADKYTSWKKRGTKIVLLPQAFGPFEKDNSADYFKKLADAVELIYARDTQSLQYLQEICGSSDKIKLSPDITIGLEVGTTESDISIEDKALAVIPNYRIIDKSSTNPTLYLDVLVAGIEQAVKLGYKPYIIIHEGKKDLELGMLLKSRVGDIQVPVITESNPLKLKKLLGKFSFVISSRFHGIVNALSQGVPCVAIGWSHKYPLLLKDFDFEEGMLDFTDKSSSELTSEIISLLSKDVQELSPKIKEKAFGLRSRVNQMWNDIDILL
jgi:polysaccharide pyruvyl transferase WcaK-like protein